MRRKHLDNHFVYLLLRTTGEEGNLLNNQSSHQTLISDLCCWLVGEVLWGFIITVWCGIAVVSLFRGLPTLPVSIWLCLSIFLLSGDVRLCQLIPCSIWVGINYWKWFMLGYCPILGLGFPVVMFVGKLCLVNLFFCYGWVSANITQTQGFSDYHKGQKGQAIEYYTHLYFCY